MMAQQLTNTQEVILPELETHRCDNCVCVTVDIHNGFLERGSLWQDCLPDVTVVVKTGEAVNSGDIVVLTLNDTVLLKQLTMAEDVIVLTEPNKEPIFVTPDDNLMLIGKPIQACYAFK